MIYKKYINLFHFTPFLIYTSEDLKWDAPFGCIRYEVESALESDHC
jgi:hypothetical protein